MRFQANTLYTGDRKSPVVEDMIHCNPEGPLLCQVTKMYPSQDATVFHALTRIYSGTLHSGSVFKTAYLYSTWETS